MLTFVYTSSKISKSYKQNCIYINKVRNRKYFCMVNGISNQNPQYAAFYRAAVGNAVVNQNDVTNMVKFLNGQHVTV